MKILFLSFVIALMGMMLFAQSDFKPGYIITNSNDTVYGQINFKGNNYNAYTCGFRTDSTTKVTIYTPGEIIGYRFTEGKFYISRIVKLNEYEQTVFLEYLVNGKAKIYFLPENYFFIETDDKALVLLNNDEKIITKDLGYQNLNGKYSKKSNQYKGVLKYYMQDSPELQGKINTMDFTQSDFIKIAADYHHNVCPNEECIIYSKEPPKVKVKLGLVAGCNYNMINIYSVSLDREQKDWSPGLMTGISVDAVNTGSFERFFTSFGLYYSNVRHDVMFNSPYQYKPHIDFTSKNLYINLLFNYIYPRYKIKPYMGIGIAYFTTLKSSENNSTGTTYNPSKKSAGSELVGGAVVNIGKRTSIKFSTSYYYGFFNNSYDYYYFSKTNNLNFLATIQFEL